MKKIILILSIITYSFFCKAQVPTYSLNDDFNWHFDMKVTDFNMVNEIVFNFNDTSSFQLFTDTFEFGGQKITEQIIEGWQYASSHINDHAGVGYLLFSDTNILSTKHYVNSREITWSMVTGKPTFFSGDYNDLINRPTLFDGDYGSLTNKPNLFSGAYADLTGKPSLFSGAYSDLTGKPTLFSGSYVDLTSKPKIPSTYSGTTNSSGVYTVTFSEAYSVAPNIQANIVNQSNTNQFIRVTSISTTGFTINVFQRNSINLLGTDVLLFSTANVNGASVDVVITEK